MKIPIREKINRIFRGAVALFLCFALLASAAFCPRAKAGGVGAVLVTLAAGATIGALASGLASYFAANGVDMSMYNMASGAAAQDAWRDLVQEYLNDTRDGMDVDVYVSSIGLSDKMFYKYYRGAVDWAAAQVSTVISALGIATVFEPILNWFTGKYADVSLGGQVVQVSRNFATEAVSLPLDGGGSLVLSTLADGGLLKVSGHVDVNGWFYQRLSGNDLNFGNELTASTVFSNGGTVGFFSTGLTPRTFDVYLRSSDGVLLGWDRYNYNYSLRPEAKVGYLAATDEGIAIIGPAYTSDDFYNVSIEFTSESPFYNKGFHVIPYEYYLGGNWQSSLVGISSVSASQQEDDGTNRFPSTSVPDNFQLVIPTGISDAGTVQPVPPETDTDSAQAAAIAAAVLDSQAINSFSVTTSDVSVTQESATPTAVPTAVPTEAVTPTVAPTVTPGGIPEEYTPDITGIFPFCIPFDFYALFTLFEAEPEAPHFTLEFPVPRGLSVDSSGKMTGGIEIQNEQFTIDFRGYPALETFMSYFRTAELILFVMALMVATRKFIRW